MDERKIKSICRLYNSTIKSIEKKNFVFYYFIYNLQKKVSFPLRNGPYLFFNTDSESTCYFDTFEWLKEVENKSSDIVSIKGSLLEKKIVLELEDNSYLNALNKKYIKLNNRSSMRYNKKIDIKMIKKVNNNPTDIQKDTASLSNRLTNNSQSNYIINHTKRYSEANKDSCLLGFTYYKQSTIMKKVVSILELPRIFLRLIEIVNNIVEDLSPVIAKNIIDIQYFNAIGGIERKFMECNLENNYFLLGLEIIKLLKINNNRNKIDMTKEVKNIETLNSILLDLNSIIKVLDMDGKTRLDEYIEELELNKKEDINYRLFSDSLKEYVNDNIEDYLIFYQDFYSIINTYNNKEVIAKKILETLNNNIIDQRNSISDYSSQSYCRKEFNDTDSSIVCSHRLNNLLLIRKYEATTNILKLMYQISNNSKNINTESNRKISIELDIPEEKYQPESELDIDIDEDNDYTSFMISSTNKRINEIINIDMVNTSNNNSNTMNNITETIIQKLNELDYLNNESNIPFETNNNYEYPWYDMLDNHLYDVSINSSNIHNNSIKLRGELRVLESVDENSKLDFISVTSKNLISKLPQYVKTYSSIKKEYLHTLEEILFLDKTCRESLYKVNDVKDLQHKEQCIEDNKCIEETSIREIEINKKITEQLDLTKIDLALVLSSTIEYNKIVTSLNEITLKIMQENLKFVDINNPIVFNDEYFLLRTKINFDVVEKVFCFKDFIL